MKIFYRGFISFMMLVAVAAGFTSCNNEDVLAESNNTALSQKEIKFGALTETSFNSGIVSRAGEATSVTDVDKFFEDKLICMYVDKVKEDNSVEALYDRRYLTVENGNLVMPEPLYFPADGSKVNIYVVAATPYSSASTTGSPVKPTLFNQYCTDWQTNSNSDLLYAKMENVTATETPLALQFKHLGTKISIAVTCQDNSKLEGLELQKNRNAFTIKMADGTFGSTDQGEKAYNKKVTMRYEDAINDRFDGNVSYASAYIAPQTMESGTEFIKFTYNDKDYFYNLGNNYNFLSGTEYKFHITLKPVSRGASDIEVVCVNEE